MEHWVQRADEAIREAEQSRAEAQALSEQLEAAIASLRRQRCMFCHGPMVDTAPLKPFADLLQKKQEYLHQGELFPLHCLQCGVYQTTEPRDTAKSWTVENTDLRRWVFAAELFNQVPGIDVVALEQAAGRGWMVKYEGTWFAVRADKAELRDLWGLNRVRTT